MKYNTKRTVAFDFDGVIHSYDKGWQGGKIYGDCNYDVLKFIEKLMNLGYAVYIHSTRNPRQIKKWIKEKIGINKEDYNYTYTTTYPFGVEVIGRRRKFWNKENILGVTRRKIPAIIYIDDRGYKFEGYTKLIEDFFIDSNK